MKHLQILALATIALSGCSVEQPIMMYVMKPDVNEVRAGAPMMGKGQIIDIEYARSTRVDSTQVELVNDKTGDKTLAWARPDTDMVKNDRVLAIWTGRYGFLAPTAYWRFKDDCLQYKERDVKRIAAVAIFEPFDIEVETRERGLAFMNEATPTVMEVADSCLRVYARVPASADSIIFCVPDGDRVSAVGIHRDKMDVLQTGVRIAPVTERTTEAGMTKFVHPSLQTFAAVRENAFVLDRESLAKFWWQKRGPWYGTTRETAEPIVGYYILVNVSDYEFSQMTK